MVENYNKDDMVIIRDPVALKGKDWSLTNVYLKKRICLNTSGCVVLARQEEEIIDQKILGELEGSWLVLVIKLSFRKLQIFAIFTMCKL